MPRQISHESQDGQVPFRASRDHEAYCALLEWYLIDGDAVMGARGTLGGVIAQLEHGGPFTGVPETDLYNDAQVGWTAGGGLVEKHRWLSAAWFSLPPERQGRLVSCYRAPPAEFRSDEGFGARETCPQVEDIERNRTIEPSLPTAFHHRRGTESRLGRYAGLAFHLCEDAGALLVACQDPNKAKASRVINRALKAAREAAIEDHKLWAVARDVAAPPRTRRQRVATLPKYTPHGASE
jgi:hypothetical protein